MLFLFFANQGQPFFFQARPGKNGKIYIALKKGGIIHTKVSADNGATFTEAKDHFRNHLTSRPVHLTFTICCLIRTTNPDQRFI